MNSRRKTPDSGGTYGFMWIPNHRIVGGGERNGGVLKEYSLIAVDSREGNLCIAEGSLDLMWPHPNHGRKVLDAPL